MPYRDIPLETWPRRAALAHFRHMAQPAFSVTVPVDVTRLRERAAALSSRSRRRAAWSPEPGN